MAAAMGEHARIKLQFLNFSCEPCWILVDFKEMKCIKDVMIKIKEQYMEDVNDLSLYLDGCILPKTESTFILRDNDCVCVRVEENPQENVLKKKKKKKYVKDEEESRSSIIMMEGNRVSSDICLQHSETEVPSETVSTEHSQSDTLSGNTYAKDNCKLKKKKRRKEKEEIDDHQEHKKQKCDSSMTQVASTFSNETDPYTDATSKPAESQSRGKNWDAESEETQAKEMSQNETYASSSITKTPYPRIEIMEKDHDTSEVADGIEQHVVSEKRKRKRHRIRKRKKRENGSGNTNYSEELLKNAKHEHKMFCEQGAVVHDKATGHLSEATSSFFSNSDSKKHFHFESSGEEEEQQHSTINIDSSVLLPSTMVSQTKIIQNVSHLLDEENANFAKEDKNVTNIKQPREVQEWNKYSRQKDSLRNPKYNVRDQGWNNCPEVVTNKTNMKNNGRVKELSDCPVSVGIVIPVKDDTLTAAETSALYVSVLPNGVPVFSRQQKSAVGTVSQNRSPQTNIWSKGVSQNGSSQTKFGDQGMSQDGSPQKKIWDQGMGQRAWGQGSFQKGYRQLSKQEQLSTQAHNSSVILVNEVTGHIQAQNSSINPWKNASCEDITLMNVEADNSSEEEDADADEGNLTAIPVGLDISGCSPLHGPPRIGDMIAYKVLEMSSNYTPEISSYKRAKVLNYDPKTGMVTLHILDQSQEERPLGKFDLVLHEEDLDGVLTNVPGSEDEVQIPWSSVIEPRLFKT